MVTSVGAATSTVMFRMRFCLAPASCSPSRSSRDRDAHAIPGLGQGEPLGLRLHGRQDGDDGQRAMTPGLAVQDAAKGLRDPLDVCRCGYVGPPFIEGAARSIFPDGQHAAPL